jgi:putrescine aminotransferase
VVDVRGAGLLWGVDLAGPEFTGEVLIGLSEQGLIVSPCLSRPRTLRLLPPMIATVHEVETGVAMLEAAIRSAAVRS